MTNKIILEVLCPECGKKCKHRDDIVLPEGFFLYQCTKCLHKVVAQEAKIEYKKEDNKK